MTQKTLDLRYNKRNTMAPVQQLGTSGKGGAVSPVNCLIQDNLNTSQNKRSRQPTLFGQKKLEITNKN